MPIRTLVTQNSPLGFTKAFIQAVHVLLLAVLFTFSAHAQDGNVIGRVLQTSGYVSATDQAGAVRALARRSNVFEGDTVITGPQGFAQIRFVDGAMLALKEDTEFTFNEYSFDGDPGTADSAVMSMVRGGFRTISGSIGDDSNDTYRVETQFANIGIRGTTHEGVIVGLGPGGSTSGAGTGAGGGAGNGGNGQPALYTGVYNGGTTVSNQFGSIDTGLGGSYDYAMTNQNQAPRGLLTQPNQLGRIQFVSETPGGDDDDEGDDGQQGGGTDQDDNGTGGDGNDDGTGDDDNGGPGGGGNDSEDGAPGGGTSGGGDDDDDPDFNTLGGNDGNTGGGVAGTTGGSSTGGTGGGGGTGGTGNTGGTTNTGGTPGGGTNNGGGTTPPPGTNTDAQINPVQNVRDPGNISNPGDTRPDSDGDGVPDEEDPFPFDGSRTQFFDRDGDGVDDRDDAYPDDPERKIFIDSDGDEVDDRDDAYPLDPDRQEFLDRDEDGVDDRDDFYPDDPERQEFIDRDDDGVDDRDDPDFIDTDGDGVVDSQDQYPNDPTNNDSDGDGIDDSEDPDFIDSDGDGVVDSQDAFPNDPSRTVAITPLLTPTQLANIESAGLRGITLSRSLYEDYEGAAPVIYHGAATGGNTGNPIIMVDDIDFGYGYPMPYTSAAGRSTQPYFVFDATGSAASSSLGFSNGIPSRLGGIIHNVQWGVWGPGQGLRLYTDISDNTANFFNVLVPMLWATTLPTDFMALPTDIATSTGKLYFGEENFIGGSSVGYLTELLAFIDFNLASGFINDGQMEFCLGSLDCNQMSDQHWSFAIGGEIVDGMVSAWPTGTREINDLSADIEGVISGLFTGANTEAFVGGFNLVASGNANAAGGSADGLFLLERDDRISGSDIRGLFDANTEAFLVQIGENRNTHGYSLGLQSGPSLVFVEEDTFNIYSAGSGLTLTQEVDATASDFDVLLQRWNGPVDILTNNYDTSILIDGTTENLPLQDSFFVRFNEQYDLYGLRGRFDQKIAFLGGTEDSGQILDLTNLSNFSFNVDFMTGSISDGYINIQLSDNDATYIESWNVLFNGSITDGYISFNILSGDGEIDSGLYLDDELPPGQSNFSDFEVSMQGEFAESISGNSLGFMTSLYLRDNSSGTPFSGNYVSGVGLIGASASGLETRFDAFAESDLNRLGLVMPGPSDPFVFAAYSTTETSTPIFVDFYDESYLAPSITLPAYDLIDYVFASFGSTPQSYTMVDGYDVTLGVWKPGSNGAAAKLTSNLDPGIRVDYGNNVYWNSVGGVAPLTTPWTGDMTFAPQPDASGMTFLGESSEGPLKGLRAIFTMDNTGTVGAGNGVLRACAGGSDPGGCGDDATFYEFGFTGAAVNGVFTGSISSGTVKHPDGSSDAVTVNGEFKGLFTSVVTEDFATPGDPNDDEDLYEAFVGGFNVVDSVDSTKYLSGTFVIEREDRLNASELLDLTNIAVLANGATGNIDFFGSNPGATNFIGNGKVFSLIGSSTENGRLVSPGGFDLIFGQWENAWVKPDNLIFANPETVSRYSQPDPIWWVSAHRVIPPSNLTGTYRTVLKGGSTPLPFLGANFDGVNEVIAPLSMLEIQFDVDLSTSMISNGTLYAEADYPLLYNYAWDITGYGGQIVDEFLVFNFDNATGTFEDENSVVYAIDNVSMRGIFVNRVSTPAFEGEGVAGAFQVASGNNKLSGAFVAGIEDVNFLDARLESLSSSEINPDAPANNGFVMIGNAHTETLLPKINPAIVANAATSPVFMSSFNTTTGYFDRVFKQGDATGSNVFPLSTDYPGVSWGIWENQDPLSGPSAFYDPNDLQNFDDFLYMPWLVVPALDPDTEIASLTGSLNYGFTRAFNAYNSWGGNLTELNVSMEIAFDNGNINQGTINLCFEGTGCGSAEEAWHGHFAAPPLAITLNSGESGQGLLLPSDVTFSSGSIWNIDGTTDSFTGEIAGSLLGYSGPSTPYDAFAGGFNLVTTGNDRSISGTFLSEQELRLTALDMNFIDGFKRGALMQGDGLIKTGLMGTHSQFSPYSVFFIEEDNASNTVWKLGNYASPSMIEIGYNSSICSSYCFIEAGIWDASAVQYTDHLSENPTGTVAGPIAWVNYTPTDFTNIGLSRFGIDSGSASQSFKSVTDTSIDILNSGPLSEFEFDVDIDFSGATASVYDSKLKIKHSQIIEGVTLDFEWILELAPNNDVIDGAGFFDENDFTSATLYIKGGTEEVVVPVDNIILSGAFNFDPDFANSTAGYTLGSLLLDASFTTNAGTLVDVQVLGEYDIQGYRETRLSQSDLEGMEKNLAILVNRNSPTIDSHFLSNGNNSSIKLAQTSITDTNLDDPAMETGGDPDYYIHEELHDYDPIPVILGKGSLISTADASVAAAGFNVGWGQWDGGADIVDGLGVVTPYSALPLYWLSAERADIADLNGLWTYSNVIAADGEGTHGILSSLNMMFDVNFGTGAISGGLFEAVLNNGTSDTVWYTNFSGSAHGPTALISNFTGSTIGADTIDPGTNNPAAAITGEMRGIFTGTGTNHGFATGFSLQGIIDGQTLPNNLSGVGLLGTRTSNNL